MPVVRPLAPILLLVTVVTPLLAQAPPAPSVPRVFWVSGVIRDVGGQPRTGTLQVQFAIYKEAEGGVPLATELHILTLDAQGRYRALLGSTLPDGLPLDVFATDAARWIGVQPAGEAELPRLALVSVPYAFKAADADTLGGRPASAYRLADLDAATWPQSTPTGTSAQAITPVNPSNTGMAGHLGVFVDRS